MRHEGSIPHTSELGLSLAVVPAVEARMHDPQNGTSLGHGASVDRADDDSDLATPEPVAAEASGPMGLNGVALKKKTEGTRLLRDTDVLLRLAAELLAKLAEANVEQKRVEHALGLSQGYLSHIKAGRNAPSAMLVSELVLLAKDPERRLKELEKFWKRELAA